MNTTRDPLAPMRSARAWAPNPANTTEWMAPMRAHASIRNTASGQVGMERVTRSPFPMPRARSAAATRVTWNRSCA